MSSTEKIDWNIFIRQAASDELRVEAVAQHVADMKDDIDPEASACSSLAVNLITNGVWQVIDNMMKSAEHHKFPLHLTKRAIISALYLSSKIVSNRVGQNTAEALDYASRLGPSVENMLHEVDSLVGVKPLGNGAIGFTIPNAEGGE